LDKGAPDQNIKISLFGLRHWYISQHSKSSSRGQWYGSLFHYIMSGFPPLGRAASSARGALTQYVPSSPTHLNPNFHSCPLVCGVGDWWKIFSPRGRKNFMARFSVAVVQEKIFFFGSEQDSNPHPMLYRMYHSAFPPPTAAHVWVISSINQPF
jgi:hypothetical protein